MKEIQPEMKSRILSSPSVLAGFQAKWEKGLVLKDFGITVSSDDKMTIIFTFADAYNLRRESFLVEIDQDLVKVVGDTH